jgi:ArsR family transcriptional regulator
VSLRDNIHVFAYPNTSGAAEMSMERPSLDELNLLHSRVCSALGDPKRLLILYTLAEGPLHVTALADTLGMPQPTISRHLNKLRQSHLVAAERDGAAVTYRLAEPRIITGLETMRSILRDAIRQQNGMLQVEASLLPATGAI